MQALRWCPCHTCARWVTPGCGPSHFLHNPISVLQVCGSLVMASNRLWEPREPTPPWQWTSLLVWLRLVLQVLLPAEGSRLIMASDGLWDLVNYFKAVNLTRTKPTRAAAESLSQVGAAAVSVTAGALEH